MNKIAIIGAGKTGRGFLARLAAESDCEVLLIDRDADLVRRLNEAGSFTVRFFGDSRPAMTVSGYRAVTWADACLGGVDWILVSVGGRNLPEVGQLLNEHLHGNLHRHIITAENCSHPAQTLRDALTGQPVSVAESTVFCTTIEDGELNIASEAYPYLQCDGAPLGGAVPPVAAIRPLDAFGNFLTRKLYTYNAASCVIAYLGFIKGYTDYGAAANDPDILALLDHNYAETNRVLCAEFGYAPDDQAEFALLSRRKFCDRTIADTVARNAREPQRKLQNAERVIGPMRLLARYGADPSVLILTAGAMLRYTDPSETEWNALCASHTPVQLLEEIAGLAPDDPLTARILRAYDALGTSGADAVSISFLSNI